MPMKGVTVKRVTPILRLRELRKPGDVRFQLEGQNRASRVSRPPNPARRSPGRALSLFLQEISRNTLLT